MNKKIDVFVNGKYEFSTMRFKTCKEAIQSFKTKAFIFVAGRNLTKGTEFLELYNKKITAHFN